MKKPYNRNYNRFYGTPMWSFIKQQLPGEIKVAVEIGTYRGHWARGALDNLNIGKLFCVDNGKKGDWVVARKLWIERLGEDALTRAFLLMGKSEQWGQVFPFEIDLLYVDGGHKWKNIYDDLRLWVPRVKGGGLIIGHDAHEKEVQRGLKKYISDVEKVKYKVNRIGPIGKPRITSFWWKKEINAEKTEPNNDSGDTPEHS